MKTIHTTTAATRKPYHAPAARVVPVYAATMLCLSGEPEDEEKTERFTVNNQGRLSNKYWD